MTVDLDKWESYAEAMRDRRATPTGMYYDIGLPHIDNLTPESRYLCEHAPEMAAKVRKLELENKRTKARCRKACEALVQEIVPAGPISIEDAAAKAIGRIAKLEVENKELQSRCENVCIGRKGNDGCGFLGGSSGDTCPDCGGMVLSKTAQLKTELETTKAENERLKEFLECHDLLSEFKEWCER